MKNEFVLRGVNNRDLDAFEAMFHAYYPRLCYFAAKILGDADAARDTVQDVLVGLWEKNIKFESRAALNAYLYKCIKTKSITALHRAAGHHRILSALMPDPYYDQAEEFIGESELLAAIMAAIDSLPAECGRIFRMSYIERMGIREICDMAGISPSTVKTQRSRAKKMLRESLMQIKKRANPVKM